MRTELPLGVDRSALTVDVASRATSGHSAWVLAPSPVRLALVLAVVLALASCSDDADETTASVRSAGMNSTPPSTPASAAPSAESWRWQGLVIGPLDGEPQACLGEIAPSDPPQCTGWPMSGFDWTAVSWMEPNPYNRNASVQLVGHPMDGVFVLDEQPLPPDPSWTLPPCEFLEGRAGDPISKAQWFTVVESPEAARSGVWLAPGLGGVDGDPAVMGDISLGLVFSNDESYAWLIDNLPGLRIRVCPQMRPVDN
jgi:hypothetical protein